MISAIVFLVYRLTQRRFSNLDDGDIDEIKWPDLLPDGQDISATTTTLMPLSTHRTNGAGVGDDGMTEYGGEGGGSGAGRSMSGVYAPVSDGRRQSTATLLSQQGYHDPYANGTSFADYSRQASYEQLAMADGGAHAFSHGYDPFAGAAGGGAIPQQGTVYPPSPPQHQTAQFGGVWPASAAPRGAPGAAGAMRVASPPPQSRTMSPPPSHPAGGSLGKLPSIRRAESPFAVPGIAIDDEEGGGGRGPL